MQWLVSKFGRDYRQDVPTVAGMFYGNNPTVCQGLEHTLSAEIGERSPPRIARIEKWFVTVKQTFKYIGILDMFADRNRTPTNQLR